MKLQVIQLEAHDDVISVRDRLGFIQADRVLLVWPRAARILRRKLDLVLIQREAARRKARLALVTLDSEVTRNAADLNISIFESVEAGQKGRWKQPISKVFIDRTDRPPETPDPYELRPHASRLNSLSTEQRRVSQIVRQVAVVALVLSVFVVAYIIGPSAQVVITPSQDQLNTTVNLIADSSLAGIDVEGGRIPATIDIIDVQTDASIPTTGSVDVPNTVASGIVTLTNQTNTQIFVPAGTIIQTLGLKPIHFHTTSDIAVGAGIGKTANIGVEAIQTDAGPSGNLPPNMIVSIPSLSKVLSVRNTDSTQGGTLRTQGLVTQADWDTLLILARDKVRQTALGQFSPRLTPTQFVAPDSIKIVEERPEWTTYSNFVGDQTANLKIQLRARVQATIVDEQQARQVAFARLVRGVSKGRLVSPDSVNYTRGAIQGTDDKGHINFVMSASANVAVSINPDVVRQSLAGMNPGDAQDFLQRTYVLDPQRPPLISITPGIFGRLPVLPFRIDVIIRE